MGNRNIDLHIYILFLTNAYHFRYIYEEDPKTNTTYLKPDRASLRELKTSIDDCVASKMVGCVFPEGASVHNSRLALPAHPSQMAFFCGHGKECDRFNSKEMLERAKNV